MTLKPSTETLNRLEAVVGAKWALREPAAMDGYMREWRGIWQGKSPLVLRPASAGEVSRIMAIAHETRTAIVPQAGNTGLVGGQIPHESGHEVVLSLDRMTRIVETRWWWVRHAPVRNPEKRCYGQKDMDADCSEVARRV